MQTFPANAGSLTRALVRNESEPIVRPLTSALTPNPTVTYVSTSTDAFDFIMPWQFWGGFDRVLDIDVTIDAPGVAPNADAIALISTKLPLAGATADMAVNLPGFGATTRLRIWPGMWLTFQVAGDIGGTAFVIKNVTDGSKVMFSFNIDLGVIGPA